MITGQQVGVFVWKEREDDDKPAIEPRESHREHIFEDRITCDDPTQFGYWMLNYRLVLL